jgi:hypothetical protein
LAFLTEVKGSLKFCLWHLYKTHKCILTHICAHETPPTVQCKDRCPSLTAKIWFEPQLCSLITLRVWEHFPTLWASELSP